MRTLSYRLAALVAAAALTACSQGASTGIVPGSAHGTGGGPGPSARATFVVHVPRHARHKTVRGAKYVAPNTQSMAITIDPGAGCTTCSPAATLYLGTTQNTPGCIASIAGLSCSVYIELHPGAYLTTIGAYDGPIQGGFPSGTLLSLDSGLTVTVAAGKANVPSITLDGIPAGITYFNLGQNMTILNGPLFSVPLFEMVGTSTHARFQVYATDPDGNVIVGPGGPAFAFAPTGGFKANVSGNTVELVSPPELAKGFFSLGITETSPACAQPAAQCTASGEIAFDPIGAVANPSTNAVVLIAGSTNLTYATVTNGIDNPSDVKYDAYGDLFVANRNGDDVSLYQPPYTSPPYETINSDVDAPTALAFSADGKYLAVVNSGNNTTTVYAAPSYGAALAVLTTPATAVAFDSQDNLWTAGVGAERYEPPSFASADTIVTNGIDGPTSIVLDSSNDLFVANRAAGTITEYVSTNYGAAPATVSSLTNISSLTELIGGDFLACYQGEAVVYTSSFVAEQAFTTNTTPCTATIDQTFALWITYADSNVVQAYQYPWSLSAGFQQYRGALTAPGAIAVYP
jgi:hypothetical protein